MNQLEFSVLKPSVDRWVNDLDAVLLRHPDGNPKWDSAVASIRDQLTKEGRLKMVLVGEWNAGKSTVVKALTGAEVKIDADVATQEASSHDWRGITLVDTPGIHNDREAADHDAIARRETVGADLVLCVVTNELFCPRLVQHFQFLAANEGLGLAGKLAVVVNKIDREEEPREEIIVGEVDQSIAPYSDTPVLLCAAKKYVDAQNDALSPAVRSRFLARSRFDTLVPAVDDFVRERGVLGKLATPVQQGVELIEEAKALLGKHGESVREEVELIRRKRRVLEKASRRTDDTIQDLTSKVRTRVLKGADAASKSLSVKSTKEDIQAAVETELTRISPELDDFVERSQKEFREILEDCDKELERIDQSPLGMKVRNAGAAHDRAGVDAEDGRPAQVAAGIRAGKKVVGDGIKNGLQRLAADPKAIRKVVLDIGHKLGKKFRPWEATKVAGKIAKSAGKAAKAVPYVAAVLDFYLAYREEQEEHKRQQHLAKARLSIMRAFQDQADLEATAATRACNKMAGDAIREAVAALAAEESNAVATEATADYLAELDGVLASARKLQGAILGHAKS